MIQKLISISEVLLKATCDMQILLLLYNQRNSLVIIIQLLLNVLIKFV